MIATFRHAIRWLSAKFTGAPLTLTRNQPKTPNPPPPPCLCCTWHYPPEGGVIIWTRDAIDPAKATRKEGP